MADEEQKTPAKIDGTPIDVRTQQSTPEFKVPPATPPTTPASTPAGVQAVEKKTVHLTDDGEIPDDADVLTLPPKAFKKRLQNASKAELNKLYESLGVKDKAELEAWRAEIEAGKKEKEEARVAALSKEEKLAEEKTKAEQERDQWKTRYEQHVSQTQMSEQRGQVMKLGAKFIDEDYLEDQLPLLAKHLTGKYTDQELSDLPDSVIEAWFADRVKAKPKLARDGAPPPALEKKALTTGTKDPGAPSGEEKVEPAKGYGVKKDAQGRTIETPEEARAARERMRQAGLSY